MVDIPSKTLFLPLGYTRGDRTLADVFGRGSYGRVHDITFNVGRLSGICFTIKIDHTNVDSARGDRFSYTEEFTALLGDEVVMKYQRRAKLLSYSDKGLEIEFFYR